MKNPNDVFWLARYVHNQLAPIIETAKVIEPTLTLTIEMTFADEKSWNPKRSTIEVKSHWARDGMFQYSPRLTDKAEVDRFVEKVSTDIEKLQADALANALMAV